ncbi:MAG: hypothetical protein ACI4D0_11280 [Lachnospira sp.]
MGESYSEVASCYLPNLVFLIDLDREKPAKTGKYDTDFCLNKNFSLIWADKFGDNKG